MKVRGPRGHHVLLITTPTHSMNTTDTFHTLSVRLSLFNLMAAGLGSMALAAQPNLPGDWPTYGNGPAHTGYFPGRLNGLPMVLKWTAPMQYSESSYK